MQGEDLPAIGARNACVLRAGYNETGLDFEFPDLRVSAPVGGRNPRSLVQIGTPPHCRPAFDLALDGKLPVR